MVDFVWKTVGGGGFVDIIITIVITVFPNGTTPVVYHLQGVYTNFTYFYEKGRRQRTIPRLFKLVR